MRHRLGGADVRVSLAQDWDCECDRCYTGVPLHAFYVLFTVNEYDEFSIPSRGDFVDVRHHQLEVVEGQCPDGPSPACMMEEEPASDCVSSVQASSKTATRGPTPTRGREWASVPTSEWHLLSRITQT